VNERRKHSCDTTTGKRSLLLATAKISTMMKVVTDAIASLVVEVRAGRTLATAHDAHHGGIGGRGLVVHHNRLADWMHLTRLKWKRRQRQCEMH
jgi:hypothetical protein